MFNGYLLVNIKVIINFVQGEMSLDTYCISIKVLIVTTFKNPYRKMRGYCILLLMVIVFVRVFFPL
jgi:hypothetical protein